MHLCLHPRAQIPRRLGPKYRYSSPDWSPCMATTEPPLAPEEPGQQGRKDQSLPNPCPPSPGHASTLLGLSLALLPPARTPMQGGGLTTPTVQKRTVRLTDNF